MYLFIYHLCFISFELNLFLEAAAVAKRVKGAAAIADFDDARVAKADASLSKAFTVISLC